MVSTIPARANSGHKWGEEGQNDSHANWRAAMDQQQEVSEATPLLSSKKPGYSSVDSDWWTELRTIGRYTLPVFG
ncbi:10018_t:CDS:1, partial [Acaulospora colombiana]